MRSGHKCSGRGNIAFQGEWGASWLAWSPDSRRIACIAPFEYYEDEEDEEQDFVESHEYVYVMGRDGSALQPLAPTTDEVGVAWSPDSQQIAYNSPGLEHLYVIGTNETAPRCLTNNIRQPSNEEDQEHGNERAEYNFIINPAWQP